MQRGVLCVPRVLFVPFFVASGAAFSCVLRVLRVPGVLRVSFSCLRFCLWGCLYMFCMLYKSPATDRARGSKLTRAGRVRERRKMSHRTKKTRQLRSRTRRTNKAMMMGVGSRKRRRRPWPNGPAAALIWRQPAWPHNQREHL